MHLSWRTSFQPSSLSSTPILLKTSPLSACKNFTIFYYSFALYSIVLTKLNDYETYSKVNISAQTILALCSNPFYTTEPRIWGITIFLLSGSEWYSCLSRFTNFLSLISNKSGLLLLSVPLLKKIMVYLKHSQMKHSPLFNFHFSPVPCLKYTLFSSFYLHGLNTSSGWFAFRVTTN